MNNCSTCIQCNSLRHESIFYKPSGPKVKSQRNRKLYDARYAAKVRNNPEKAKIAKIANRKRKRRQRERQKGFVCLVYQNIALIPFNCQLHIHCIQIIGAARKNSGRVKYTTEF